jgi:hypothetical protein
MPGEQRRSVTAAVNGIKRLGKTLGNVGVERLTVWYLTGSVPEGRNWASWRPAHASE